jgi:hypothetical protein
MAIPLASPKSLSVNGSRRSRLRHSGCLNGRVHLVEAFIAASLLAAVCVSLPRAFAGAVEANLAAGDATWTVVLAAQKVEELRSRPVPDLAALESHELLDDRGRLVDVPRRVPAYIRTWRTEPFAAAPDQTVVITVVVAPYRYAAGKGGDAAALVTARGATRLVTLRTRKAT